MATGGEMSLELGGALVNGEEGEERLDHTEIEVGVAYQPAHVTVQPLDGVRVVSMEP